MFELLYEKSIAKRVDEFEESEAYVTTAKIDAISGTIKEEVQTTLDDAHLMEEKREKEQVLNDDITSSITGESAQSTETHLENKQIKFTNEPLDNYLDISFNDFDNIFGKESKLNKGEKRQIWMDKYKGKYVKWTGKIGYKGIAVYDWNKIGIRHKDSNIDVQLRFDWTKKRKLMKLNVGDVITYTGRLVSLSGFLSPYKLINADVLEIR